MAPVATTADYYLILGITQSATLDVISQAYKKLALKLHPDRNKSPKATADFQLLNDAYSTLKEPETRRQYDMIYHTLRNGAQTKTEQAKPVSEDAQLAALAKSIQERFARWQDRRASFDTVIWGVQREVDQIKKQIEQLLLIAAAEKREDNWNNGWSAWLLSPLYKKAKQSEEQKADKDRARQERRLEKDMKERRLSTKESALKEATQRLERAQAEVTAANNSDTAKIQAIQIRIQARQERERQEKQRAEQARQAEIRRQQEEIRRQQEEKQRQEEEAYWANFRRQQAEAAARLRKEAEERVAELRRQAEKRLAEIRRQAAIRAKSNIYCDDYRGVSAASHCLHGGWWSKVQGCASCPRCDESWTYLLQCPGCEMQACPPCQAIVRPRGGLHRVHRSNRSRRTEPLANHHPIYDYLWDD